MHGSGMNEKHQSNPAGGFSLLRKEPMASRIRGITVEIGGNTTKLEQSLKSINNTIKSTQSQLKDVTRLLILDPCNIRECKMMVH